MSKHPSKRLQLAYKEEMINLIRDFATDESKKGRRRQLKDFYKKSGNHIFALQGMENFEKADNTIKKTWKNIIDFSEQADNSHLEE